MNRVRVFKTILWSLIGLGASVAISRFAFGLGATTNLTDATPWGLWIGFDVMAGVALAAGGFVMTAVFYMIGRKEFHPMVRPAVLTAFLGYIAVVMSLMVDLGLPWNIWHMLIYWNPHSPLFEVGWCVMLYSAVLMLEFSPVPLESTSRYARVRTLLLKFRFPLVLVGIMLSTLHQSSLGSLFLIMPFKLHPLWYTGLLPILFFISAIALGLMMVSFESLFSAWLYRRTPETALVAGLGRAVVWVLGVYLAVRFANLAWTGKLPLLLTGSWESILLGLELLILAIIPMVIFLHPLWRVSTIGQWLGSAMVVFGAIFNRINVGGLTMIGTTGDSYVPSWMELSVSLSIVAAMALVFLFAIEKFNIWHERPEDAEMAPHTPAGFSRSGEVWLGTPAVAGRVRYSLAFVIALAVGFALMPGHKLESKGVPLIDVEPARGGEVLLIDGNLDGYGVAFAHKTHIDSLGGDSSCVRCHHLNLPGDKQSRCASCHSSMYATADAFRHGWHGSPSGAKVACNECHDPSGNRTATTAKACKDCHADMVPAGSGITVTSWRASSYTDALHGVCVTCHRLNAVALVERPHLAECATCHSGKGPEYLREEMALRMQRREFNRVVLPGVAAADNVQAETP
jgi:Ni/Fe-hydrogenase subunit HybB-like protein